MIGAEAAAFLAEYGEETAREASRAAMWEAGDLSWALHEGQVEARAVLDDAYQRGIRRGVLMCGRRWGKTRLVVVDAIEHALHHPGSRIPYGALTWESAAEFVFPEAEELAKSCPAHMRPAIVDGEVRFHNGSRIVVSGCEDERKANRLRGPKATRAYIDEAGFIDILPYVAKSILAQQLLTTDGMLIVAGSPPMTPVHPFVEMVAGAKARNALIVRKTSDAPHIGPEKLARLAEELGGVTSTDYRRECDCEIITDETRAVLPEWAENEHLIVPALGPDGLPEWWPYAEHRKWFVAADLGYVDLTAVLIGWYDFVGHRLVVEDERILIRPTSGDVQAAAREMEEHFECTPSSRVADASLITIADMAKLQSLEEPHARWRLTQKDDLEGAINALRVGIRRHELVVHPRCVATQAHAKYGIWNRTRTKFAQSDEKGLGHFDALAALIYLWRSVRKSNPTPDAGPQDYTGRWVPDVPKKRGKLIPRPRRRR